MTLSEPTNPRYVTPGIETHHDLSKLPEPGIYVGLDWIRCTGPDDLVIELEKLFNDKYQTNATTSHGAKWFRAGLTWEPGVMLSWRHRSDICQVDIQGQRLRLMTGGDRIELLRSLLELGMKPTRIDGALDYIGQELGICDAAKASSERGELCILRKFSPNNEYTAQGIPTRLLLKLGSRESAVCARIYDKGLEQGSAPAGYHERIEIEWKSDRAPLVASALLREGQDWPDSLVSLILGAVEFREVNGRTELIRRPFSRWWADLIQGKSLARIAPETEDESFAKWWAWFRGSVAPRLLEFSHECRLPIESVVNYLVQDVRLKTMGGQVLTGFRNECLKLNSTSKAMKMSPASNTGYIASRGYGVEAGALTSFTEPTPHMPYHLLGKPHM